LESISYDSDRQTDGRMDGWPDDWTVVPSEVLRLCVSYYGKVPSTGRVRSLQVGTETSLGHEVNYSLFVGSTSFTSWTTSTVSTSRSLLMSLPPCLRDTETTPVVGLCGSSSSVGC
ncbi:hypothetical protein RUM44_009443, partial [Polyplax serrata]